MQPYTSYISTPWSLDSPTKSTPKSYTYNYKAQQQKRVVCVPPEEIKRTTGREILTDPKIEAAYERWLFTALLCRVRTATSLSSAEAQHRKVFFMVNLGCFLKVMVWELVDYVTNQKEGRKSSVENRLVDASHHVLPLLPPPNPQ